MRTLQLVVPAESAGTRLDRFLADSLPDVSRSQVQRLIEHGHVRVAGKPATPAQRMAAHALVEVTLRDAEPSPLVAEPLTVPLLFVDPHLIVVNKPPGLVVHPGAGNREHTLVNQLISRFPEIAAVGHPLRPGIVHRLDKDTSGVLVVARTPLAYQWLVRQFSERSVHKEYVALVVGHPTVERGVINAPVGRDLAERTHMGVVSAGKPAVTHFTVLAHFAGHTLLQVRPDTGRTHQIRVHLAAVGLPVAGDSTYGKRGSLPGLTRQFLHAWKLAFLHPATKARVEFCAPLPPDLTAVLRALGGPAALEP